MSADRLYNRERSLSCVRRSASFDPYLLTRSRSALFFDQNVRRSFTPLREKLGLTASRYSSTPYGFHYSRPEYRSTSRPRVLSSSNLYRSPSPASGNVIDSPVFGSRYKFDHYVPSGWSAPIYRYLHPLTRSRSTECGHSHSYGYASSYASPYGTVYKPPPMRYTGRDAWASTAGVAHCYFYTRQPPMRYTGRDAWAATTPEPYHYYSDTKQVKGNAFNWRRWLDSGSGGSTSHRPSYRSYYGESSPGSYNAHWTSAPRQYRDKAIWI